MRCGGNGRKLRSPHSFLQNKLGANQVSTPLFDRFLQCMVRELALNMAWWWEESQVRETRYPNGGQQHVLLLKWAVARQAFSLSPTLFHFYLLLVMRLWCCTLYPPDAFSRNTPFTAVWFAVARSLPIMLLDSVPVPTPRDPNNPTVRIWN